jgi:hypothetical protein
LRLLALRRRVERVEQHLAVAGDRLQDVVEVVRDTAGEPAERLHPLCVTELLLELLVSRDIADEVDDRAIARRHLG